MAYNLNYLSGEKCDILYEVTLNRLPPTLHKEHYSRTLGHGPPLVLLNQIFVVIQRLPDFGLPMGRAPPFYPKVLVERE